MSYPNESPPPWQTIKIVKQEKLEYDDNFFCLASANAIATADLSSHDIDILALKKEIEVCFPNTYDWDAWKKLGNPYECIFTPTKDIHPLPSVSVLNPLSRSYFKLWEIFMLFDIKFPQRMKTAHVCEGPGGFIQCAYEWAEKAKTTITATNAMTLRPDHPSIPGWRRATNFLKKHRQINIEYGPSNDGNILLSENQDYFVEKAKGAHLFTADGGFDFSEEYDRQEINMYPLIVSSALIGLQTLAVGGHAVIKVFDMHYQLTRDVISLIASTFRQWVIYKPATSRPCNSERYFIGMDYRGKSPNVISMLKKLLTLTEDERITFNSFLNPTLSEKFRVILEEQNKPVLEKQRQSIAEVLHAYKTKTFEEYYNNSLALVKKSEEWCLKFKIPYHKTTIKK